MLSLWKRLLFGLILIGLVCVVIELIGAKLMTPSCEIGRRILLGRENVQLVRVQNTIGQPYLLYICAPNYCHPVNGPQHNADGYRGKAVPLDRRPGVLRVLCLGGSTTYGWTVPFPNQTYPAVLEELLRAKLPAGYTDVEVINGGLPYGTSAEIFTHYHFKYYYYHPDVVIINEGGNDALGYTLPYYHPDNSNWRQPLINLRPLPKRARWLANSRFMSYIMLNVFYVDQLTGGEFYIRGGAIPPAPWFKPKGRLLDDSVIIPYEQLSFAHNMEALIQEIMSAGVKVLLVPFRTAPGIYEAQGKDYELSQILRHEQIFKDFAQKYQVGLAPFPAEVIASSNWADHCHLNPDGERQKAGHIAPYVLKLLSASEKN
ncbi:MAG: GDSL-type esterase/lipase family protein [Kiritimatiellia bacterium]|nr:GDSL-type esterase/lipase family protein [Kiritimatiellia bacterium]